jgi:hypothetical protein
MDWVRVIAVLQVLGGVYGLLQLVASATGPEEMQEAGVLSYSVYVALLLASVSAGVLLWLKNRRGFVWSIILQFLQAVRFTFGPLNYGFLAMPSLEIYIRFLKGNSGIGLNLHVLESYLYLYTKVIYKYNLYLPFETVVNVSSLLCFFYLYFIFDRLFPMHAPQTTHHAALYTPPPSAGRK